ncbi:sugar ABC transporter ATP-binding protein [Phytohabitans kaempferiae]|uniref:Sugar ABC transporter ATP-binding protein n=1 Tax=Phytohabitans kaempferiae TaxID=1620943 RepID=A0ABV6LY78_9ACTN
MIERGGQSAGLEVRGLTKSYGSTRILHGLDFAAGPGSVHALLGPNGAGKSTLIKCVNGVVGWEQGTITIDGAPLSGLTPGGARELGVATIHQHLSLIDSLTVAENIFLGREMRRGPWLRRRAQRVHAHDILGPFRMSHLVDAPVSSLGAGQKQLVEVAKALAQGETKVLILDEPTASLSGNESETLFGEIARLKAEGVSIIYVTHRLGEVFRIADQVTVLKNGHVELSEAINAVKPIDVYRALSATDGEPNDAKRNGAGGPVALAVQGLRGPRFGPVSLDVKKGEILGLYGALGAGRTSLLETLAGRYPSQDGSVQVNDQTITLRSINAAQRQGIALIPADRRRQGLWPSQSASMNALLPSLGRIARHGILRRPGAERIAYAELADSLEIVPPHPDTEVSTMSGGNAQKVLVARWLAVMGSLQVLLVDEPTNGVDIRAREQIHKALVEAAAEGLAVVVSSSDAEELVAFADRVLIFDNGRVINQLTGADITEANLLAAAHQVEQFTAELTDQTSTEAR